MHDSIDYENMGFKYKLGLFPNEERALRVYNFALQLEGLQDALKLVGTKWDTAKKNAPRMDRE